MSLAQRLLAALLLCFAAAWATAEVAVPPLKARVTDVAGALTSAQRTALEERLAAFEEKKGSQIAVLIVPTTQPETIEQYGIRVAEAWKLGRKGVDDGAILLVALNDRAVRIEVGYGLEGVLPDAIAKRIIDEDIVPRFRSGDYYGGIEAGAGRMIRVVEGEPLPPPRARAPAQQDIGLQELLVLGMLLVFVAGGILRAMFGRILGSGVVGAVGGFVAWMLVGSVLAAIVLGILVALFSAIAGGASRFPPGRGGWYPGGGWSSGGGGFGGGGGFSGGGGGFGGGGASGRW